MTDQDLITKWSAAAAGCIAHYADGGATSVHVPARELARLCELAEITANGFQLPRIVMNEGEGKGRDASWVVTDDGPFSNPFLAEVDYP